MSKQYELINLKSFDDERGGLIAFENGKNCPFDVKRCFFTYDTKGSDTIRGAHANKKSKFLLVVVSGSCRVKVDTGTHVDEILLNDPHVALYLDSMVWKEMFQFSYNAVLMVLSNELYDETEYIRDYQEFKQIMSK